MEPDELYNHAESLVKAVHSRALELAQLPMYRRPHTYLAYVGGRVTLVDAAR